MAADCPECMAAAAVLRQTADALAGGVGGFVGGRIAGVHGAMVGRAIAPELIERGAMAVARKVKKRRSRKQSKNGKDMSRAMKAVNKKARTKSGKLKKGWTMGRIMRESHKECKRRRK